MFIIPLGSRYRLLRNGPASTGKNPNASASVQTVRFAELLSPAMKT